MCKNILSREKKDIGAVARGIKLSVDLEAIEIILHNIKKTSPCDSYPLTPHFYIYIVKLWFTGVNIILLFLL